MQCSSVLHISNTDTLKSIYFAYFHSLIKYEIIWGGGNSSDSKKIFTLQKKIVRTMMGVKSLNSCRELFKRLQILSLPCEYIFSLINFIINNQERSQINSAVHNVNTRNKRHLHRSIASLLLNIMWAENFAPLSADCLVSCTELCDLLVAKVLGPCGQHLKEPL
jgi:hypothetical protein